MRFIISVSYIIYGNEIILTTELFGIYGYNVGGFSGVGDINNDGYDNFCLGYKYIIEEDYRYTNTFYYGAENIDPEPTLILWDCDNTYTTLGLPAVDLNADGYDDFGGHFGADIDIWFGNDIITTEYDFTLTEGSGGRYGFAYGDVNNDGYSDLAVGSHTAGLNGKAFLYLGGETPNNTYALEFEEPPGVHHDYGTR